MTSQPQRRAHFRIDYPLAKRAKLQVKERTFDVIDLSQRGIKISVEGNARPEGWMLHENLMGILTFLINKRLSTTGKVIRVSQIDVIIHLDDDLPLDIVNEEHRYIITHFPDHKSVSV